MVNEPTSEELQGINTVLKKVNAKQKRKQRAIAAIIIVAVIAIAAFFLVSFQPPEPLPPADLCLNGVLDAGEEGIDCGGICSNQCEEPPPAYVDTAYILPATVSDLAVDLENDRIYVLDEMRHRIMVYDSEFNHIENFGETREETADGGWNYKSGGLNNDLLLFPASIYIANGKVYVLDRAPRIQVFNKSLEFEKTLNFSPEVIEKLPKIPDTPNTDGGTSSIAVSGNGNVYVADEVSNAIALLGPNLDLIKAIEPSDPNSVNMPRQISIGPNGNVFVADSGNGRIQVFDSELNFVKSITENLLMPVGIFVSGNGEMFVLDNGDSKLKVIDLEGNIIEEIGRLGKERSEFYNSRVIKLNSGLVFVVEEGNNRIQLFNTGLEFERELAGLKREFNVSFTPFYPAISPNGDIAFSDPINSQVFILDPEFNLKKVIGEKGFANNQFNTPKGLAFGPGGKLFVSDSGNRRVQVFSKDYEYLKTITNGALIWPLAISISENNKIYVVDDKYKNVLIFNQAGSLIGEIGAEHGIVLPLGILAQGGKIYITDDVGQTIEIFDSRLDLLESVSGIDDALGVDVEFNESLGIDGQNRLLFCDNRNRTVIAFDLATSEFSAFGDFGSALQELSILEIAATPELVVVADMENHKVKIFGDSENLLTEITINNLS